MSWKEAERICRELGIEMMKPDDPMLKSIFGSHFVPGRLGGVGTGGAGTGREDADATPHATRGEDPQDCPFNTMHSEFGEGSMVVIPSELFDDLLARRFGDDAYLEGITHLLYDRDNYDEDELQEGRWGLATTPPFSNGVPYPTADRRSPVSIRRKSKRRIVISQRRHASDPIDSRAGTLGCMRIHRGDPMRDHAHVFEMDCTCLATAPFTRWLIEGDAAERLEVALRRTDELVEFGVYGTGSALRHSTWLIGRARGRGAALWPTPENACSQTEDYCTSIHVGDPGIGDEVRRELVGLNELHGVPVPGKFHGDLDAASAWHMLLNRTRR